MALNLVNLALLRNGRIKEVLANYRNTKNRASRLFRGRQGNSLSQMLTIVAVSVNQVHSEWPPKT
jgi:hypothetical protein